MFWAEGGRASMIFFRPSGVWPWILSASSSIYGASIARMARSAPTLATISAKG